MEGSAAPTKAPPLDVEAYLRFKKSQSPASTLGPTRTSKKGPHARHAPYTFSKTHPSQPTLPSFSNRRELCFLLTCRKTRPHTHTHDEVEEMMGFRVGKGISLRKYDPITEQELQKHLDKKIPKSAFAAIPERSSRPACVFDTGHERGSRLHSIYEEALTKLYAVDPDEDGRLSDKSGIPKGGIIKPISYDTPQTLWPCGSPQICSIKGPHKHNLYEFVNPDTSYFRESPPTTHDIPSYISSPPIPSWNDRAFSATTMNEQSLPDMRWKPCSMLDSFSTNSTLALINALPSIQPSINQEADPPFGADWQESNALDTVQHRGREMQFSLPVRRKPMQSTVGSKGAARSKGDSAKGAQKLGGDDDGKVVDLMERNGVEGAAGEMKIDDSAVDERRSREGMEEAKSDRMREVFLRLGYFDG